MLTSSTRTLVAAFNVGLIPVTLGAVWDQSARSGANIGQYFPPEAKPDEMRISNEIAIADESKYPEKFGTGFDALPLDISEFNWLRFIEEPQLSTLLDNI